MLQGGKEVEPSRVEGRLQSFEEQATEQAREHAHGQKEPRATGDPLASIGSDATAGYDAVQVGVKKQILAPSVQNGQESDFSSQMSRIGGNCLQGLRGSTEKDVIECCLVLIGDGGDLLGESEHDVEILCRKEFGLTVLQPLCASE